MTNDGGMTKPEAQNVRSTVFPHLVIPICFELGYSDFVINGQSGSDSHMFDHIIAELRTFNFCRAFHQTREIVGDALARDRAV
jgi:hypothetical protein